MQTTKNNYRNAPDLEAMVTALYGLSALCIWPRKSVSHQQTADIHCKLKNLILQYSDQYGGYIECVQRILLCGEYRRLYEPGHFCASPESWLTDKNGYLLSAAWYCALERKRITIPLYKLEWKGLAEAMLELTDNYSVEIFRYWGAWFRRRNAVRELVLFNQYLLFLHDSQEGSLTA